MEWKNSSISRHGNLSGTGIDHFSSCFLWSDRSQLIETRDTNQLSIFRLLVWLNKIRLWKRCFQLLLAFFTHNFCVVVGMIETAKVISFITHLEVGKKLLTRLLARWCNRNGCEMSRVFQQSTRSVLSNSQAEIEIIITIPKTVNHSKEFVIFQVCKFMNCPEWKIPQIPALFKRCFALVAYHEWNFRLFNGRVNR